MASDRIFGLVVVLVALAYGVSATQIQSSFLAEPVGPRMFPYLISGVAGICGFFLMARPDPDPDWPAMRTFGALAFSVAVLVAYAYALKPMGFLVPTALAAGLLSYQISPQPAKAAMAGVGLSVGLFVLFKFVLGLGLFAFPKGMIG